MKQVNSFPISVCLLVKNGEKTLSKSLESTKNFNEVCLLDTGSSDQTLEIAAKYDNVKIYHSPFTSFGPLRNKIAALAQNPWILCLDADEVLSSELLNELRELKLDPQFAYSIRRKNFYNGKHIRGCGWSPDRVTRLYHRDHHSYTESKVHESIQSKNEIFLKNPIHHTPYLSTEDFLRKMQQYSTLFAEDSKKKSSFSKALFKGLFSFFRSYFLKLGFRDGKEGFLISFYNANTTFYKYLKLSERK